MYYKIENKDSEVYRKLHEMRSHEIETNKRNLQAVKDRVGLDFYEFIGLVGQQNYWRTTQYEGFKFKEPEKVDPKVWVLDKDFPDYFVPNKRTKAGREMDKFLNSMSSSHYRTPLNILGLPSLSKFKFPFIEIVGDLIVMHLDDQYTLDDPNIIEITSKEFFEILKTLMDQKS